MTERRTGAGVAGPGPTAHDLQVGPWSRRRLRCMLVVVLAVAVTAVLGVGYAIVIVVFSVAGPRDGSTVGDTAAHAAIAAVGLPSGTARRDAIAAAPMLAVPPEAGRGGTPSARPAPVMRVPPAGRVGPSRVPTGYPRTDAGAVGQLAAIETTVLQGMSVAQARTVYGEWAAPGAPPVETWELIGDIQAFLGSSAGQQSGDPTTAVTTVPVAAQVKGDDTEDIVDTEDTEDTQDTEDTEDTDVSDETNSPGGTGSGRTGTGTAGVVAAPGWVVACVLLDVRARVVTDARVAYGFCSRMVWVPDNGTSHTGSRDASTPSPAASAAGASSDSSSDASSDSSSDFLRGSGGVGRWVIGPGAAAARAPSTWPGTDLALRAGWQTWDSSDVDQ